MRNCVYNVCDVNVGVVMFEILWILKLLWFVLVIFGGDGIFVVWLFCIYFLLFYLMFLMNIFVESWKCIINIFEILCLIFFGEGYIKIGKILCYGVRED